MTSPSLVSVTQIYFTMLDELDMMLAACKTNSQRLEIKAKLDQARQNYYTCLNQSFADQDPTLIALNTQAKASIATLRAIESELGNITKVLDDLTQAVTITTQIAAKIL